LEILFGSIIYLTIINILPFPPFTYITIKEWEGGREDEKKNPKQYFALFQILSDFKTPLITPHSPFLFVFSGVILCCEINFGKNYMGRKISSSSSHFQTLI